MKYPELPLNHCANQSPEQVMNVFVRSIAPDLKSGSINARRAASELVTWREFHPDVFSDWNELCWKYIQQPPEWVDWLIQGVRATSEEVVEADKLVAAAQAAAASRLAAHRRPTTKEQENKVDNVHFIKPANQLNSNSQERILRRIARDQPDLLNEIGHGKRFKSARAAAIETGIITPFPSLQLKEPAPTAQKLLDKKGQAWCLQLMEELSELCL